MKQITEEQIENAAGNIAQQFLNEGKEGTAYFTALAYAGAKWMQEQQGWISVGDRLPPVGKDVLVWQENLSDPKSSRLQKAHHSPKGVFSIYPRLHRTVYLLKQEFKNYDLEGDMCQLTHWQFAPEPPRKEADNV